MGGEGEASYGRAGGRVEAAGGEVFSLTWGGVDLSEQLVDLRLNFMHILDYLDIYLTTYDFSSIYVLTYLYLFMGDVYTSNNLLVI